MTYAEAVQHLYALGPELAVLGSAARRRFDLAHMRAICAGLENPERRVPSVLIAGTNGKGSTAATLASILTAAGYRTGLYTSPHLERINERIQLGRAILPSEYGTAQVPGADGLLELLPISDDEFARLYTLVDNTCEGLVQAGTLPLEPSFFERLTAVAFLYFAEEAAEIMVLEVGLGGRLDATNVVEPLVSVITDIALDHQEYLGKTIAEIAGEKCGILREGGTLVTLSQLNEANQAIGLAATQLGVRGINAAEYMPAALRNSEQGGVMERQGGGNEAVALPPNRYRVRVGTSSGREEIEVDSPLAGEHQRRNLALAIATAVALREENGSAVRPDRHPAEFQISNAAIKAGIRGTKWPGRLELIAPNLLLDVAHNPAGAWTLRAALSLLPADRPRTLIFSCLRDKNLEEMSRILFPLFDSTAGGDPLRIHDHIILAPLASVRATRVEDMVAAAKAMGVPAHAAPHVEAALAEARAKTPPGGLIVATGSIYLVGEIRRLAGERRP